MYQLKCSLFTLVYINIRLQWHMGMKIVIDQTIEQDQYIDLCIVIHINIFFTYYFSYIRGKKKNIILLLPCFCCLLHFHMHVIPRWFKPNQYFLWRRKLVSLCVENYIYKANVNIYIVIKIQH